MEHSLRQSNISLRRIFVIIRRWWRDDISGSVNQGSVIAKRREDCKLTGRYMFMTAMSGGIAILGLLLSSPAVVIGAMLLSPLMGPIMGLGFALAIGDYAWLRQSAISLACGTLMGIGLCAFVVFFSPLQDITPEIAARTRPNLFDLMIALFSAMAGAYAMIRGREGTIVGVAIATALMPPLAVVGFGLATANGTVFIGALMLYVTNLVTIALTAWVMARFYGFTSSVSERHTLLQNIAIAVVFVALAVPLALSLRQIAWETNATQQVRLSLAGYFGKTARLSQPEISFGTDPLQITAFAWTTKLEPQVQEKAQIELSARLGRKVKLDLKQFLVRDQASAEKALLASAKEHEQKAQVNAQIEDLALRLELAAGVPNNAITIDRDRMRAIVRAKPLPGATLASYQALEQRIAATMPDWNIELVPPHIAAPLPAIPMGQEGLDDAGERALALVAWAARRTGNPVELVGPDDQTELAANWLAQHDVRAAVKSGRKPMKARWDGDAENADGGFLAGTAEEE